MKTYKETLYKKWWKLKLTCGVPLFCIVILFVYTDKGEYLYLFIPVLLISSFFGGVKCPGCKTGLHIPPAPKGFKALNYCGECGFDLNQDPPKVWSRLDKDAPHKP